MIRRLGLVAVALAVLAGGAPAAQPAGSLAGIEWTFRQGGRLVWLDASLRPLADPAIRLAEPAGVSATGGTSYAYRWAFSPDGSRLVVGTSAGLRVVDPGRRRLVRTIREGEWPVAWPVRNRVFAIDGAQLLTIDPTRGRVLAEGFLDGEVVATAQTRTGVAVLLGSAGELRAARLAVAGTGGRVRNVTLRRLRAGWKSTPGTGHDVRVEHPGLTVDRAGGRAFVVGAGALVAEVDLRTLAVRYHRLAVRSLQKTVVGPSRCARWLGDGLVAVSGSDSHGRSFAPAGLTVIDVATWTARRLDDRASALTVAGGLVLAAGERGVVAYAPDGSRRFEVLGGEPAWVVGAVGGTTYLGTRDRTLVLDLAAGRIVGEVRGSLPLLVTPADGC